MVFKELIKRPIPSAPETDIPADIVVHTKPSWSGSKGYDQKVSNYIYTAETDGEMLIVTVYYNGKFKWRTFIGDTEYYTQHTEIGPRKSTASVDYLSTYSQSYIPVNGADGVIKKYVSDRRIYDLPRTWGNWDDGIKTVSSLQKYIRDKKIEERHRCIRETTEKCMLEIRPPLKAFTEWVKHQSDKIYIVYHTEDDYGVCSHCMKKVKRGKWKHRDKVTCPNCHKKAQIICSGRFKYGRHEHNTEWFWYVQNTSGGCCARLYKVNYYLCKGDYFIAEDKENTVPLTCEWGVRAHLYEKGRYFLDFEGRFITGYEWDNFMNTGTEWWCKRSCYINFDGKLYTSNLRQVLRQYEQIKYMPWDKVAKIFDDGCIFTDILKKMIRRPWIEYLIKEKMLKLARHYIETSTDEICVSDFVNGVLSSDFMVGMKKTSLAHILGLNRRELRDVKPYDPTYHEMKLYKYLLRHRAGIEEWKQLRGYVKSDKHEEYVSSNKLGNIIAALEYQPAERYLRYVKLQEKLYQEQDCGDINAVISDYADYIREAVNANYDMNDTATINPKSLIVAHADSEIDSRLEGYKRNYSQYAEQLAVVAENLKSIEGMVYEDQEYCIAPIMSWDELLRESKYLQHCVASYAQKYAEGRCVIIGIRNITTPDMPMYTLELSGDYKQVWQCRGYRNHSAPDKVRAVVDKWHKALISKNSKKAG